MFKTSVLKSHVYYINDMVINYKLFLYYKPLNIIFLYLELKTLSNRRKLFFTGGFFNAVLDRFAD